MFGPDQLNRLYRYGLALARDPDAAHDLVQGALLRYLERSSEPATDTMAYLRRSMRNAAIDSIRAEQRHAGLALNTDDSAVDLGVQSLEQMLIAQADIERIWRDLSVPEREVLFLWAVEGHTVEEIAAHTGTPRGTLLSRLHRLRRRIQAMAGSPESNTGRVSS